MSHVDELERLHGLFQKGALTAQEFDLAKQKLLAEGSVRPTMESPPNRGLRGLARSETDAVFFGVCGGLGQATPIPTWIWRVIFLVPVWAQVSSFLPWAASAEVVKYASGISIFVYFVLGVTLPSAPKPQEASAPMTKEESSTTTPEKAASAKS